MSFEPINVEFLINNDDVKAASEGVKKSLMDIGFTAEEAEKKINKRLNAALEKQAFKTMPLVQQQGIKTQRVWNGLGNSINQLSREIPAFAVNAQTGFLAISNNLPILADEIQRLRDKNAALVASGKKGVPVWKQVVSGLFSWNTALSIGVSLLTIYGADLVKWVERLIKGKEAVKELTEAEKKLSKQKKDLIKNITKEYGELAYLVNRITKTNITQEKRIKLLKELNEKYPFLITQVDKESVSNIELAKRLKEVNKLYIARIALQLQQKNIELAFNQVAEKKLKLGKEEIATEDQLAKLAAVVNKDRSAENRLYQLDLENKTYAEKIKVIKQALETEVNYFAQVSAKGGENEKAYTARFNNRKKQLALIREYEKAVGRSGFDLNDTTANLTKEQEILANLEKKYKISLEELNDLFNTDVDKTKSNKETISKYQSLLDKLAEIDKEYSRKSFTKDQEELQALADKFSKIRTLVERFNADPANKAQIIDLTAFNNLETQATADVTFRQETGKLQTEITEKKKLYEEFEAYKKKFGTAAAKEEFANKIGEAESYYAYLKNLERKNETAFSAVKNNKATGGQTERVNFINKNLKEATKEQQSIFNEQLANLMQYHQKRAVIIENYNTLRAQLIAEGRVVEAVELDAQHKEELDKLDDANVKKLKSYKELQKGIVGLSKQQAKIIISNAETLLFKDNISEELKEKIRKAIAALQKEIKSSDIDNLFLYTERLGDFGLALQDLGDAVGSSDVRNAGAFLSGIADGLDDFFKALDAETDAEKTAAAITAVITLISTFASAAAKRKAAEEEYYLDVIGFQNQYNLALQEQKRLQAELSENVFITDYVGRIEAGVAAIFSANNGLQDALDELKEKGKAVIGKRNAIDWGNVGTATAAGAAFGSVVPIVGTIVGAIGGAIVGLFSGKKKDRYSDILKEYPELIQQSVNGLDEIDVKMAELLIANNLVKGETKAILEDIIGWQNELEAAREQIKEVITTLTGSLGDDLRTTLVDAFVAGEDAAIKMGDTVEAVLENVLSNFIFNQIFQNAFDELEGQMAASFDVGGDSNWVDDFSRFFTSASALTDDFNAAMADAQKEASALGFSIFDNANTENGLVAATRASMTEDTANELTGLWRGSFDLQKRHYQVVEDYLQKTDNNISVFSAMLLSMEATKINTHLTVEELKKINTKLVEIQSSKTEANSRDLGI